MPEARRNPTAAQVADEFSRTAKVLVRHFNERLGEHGVSTPRSRLVVEVARSQPVRLTELALAVGIAQGTASTLVDALVRDGLLERQTSPRDRRSVRLRVTEQGAALAQDWTSGYEVAAEELFSPLSEEQMTTLVDILRILGAEERSPAGD
ncbi:MULTISPECIES: MarR family winged helix-turn-helix transcriptional regulator [Streptomyces]|uniref:MarR family transcriptional regulator n=2 Tax=Streptomyces griseoaurantiacus TaxID=68213 RepID=F3NEQ3_9ACTN|nr:MULTISPECIES: MarR family transcriptional regulator [Streptomyces]GHE68125.1 MarR family transcriptional regulator [Streptomyces griseoaurantiacus]EGG48037.1 MarR family transcriptional regulator [Streptomyces griseoaurantiacus M045]MCF0088194.1 HTH-type transcriptional regulator MhqR [Streptomyces sp. MH192]MCF0099082.1 HTH-type transcriptional regulator MhqR [Streptomyces sp. MH191]SDG37055.1 transcriptional regulator, MarR family [Streptomyces jietaisiensis]